MLCRRRGEVVPHEDILREVWDGRAISPNSVPVVISDLRQALGDAARDPRYIETVAKRGYRLLAQPASRFDAAALAPPGVPRRRLVAGLVILLLAAVILAVALGRSRTRVAPLIVTDVVNATGSDRYRPLADATSEVILANARRIEGVEVFRNAPARAGSVTLGARLIIWSGRPTVMMSASDASGAVIWTGMTSGSEDLIPPEVAAAMQDLSAKLDGGRD